jgi:hypothetical protein
MTKAREKDPTSSFPTSPSLLDRLSRIRPAAILATGCLLFAALSAWALSGESCTYDEGIHLSSAYAGLTRRDFRLVVEHPPLGRRLAAIPLLFMKVRLPAEPEHWRPDTYWAYAFQFLYQCGNDPDDLLRAGRWAMLFWPLLLIGAVYAWSLELYGPKGGLLTLALTVFNPTLLAHGHLVTTDTAVSALMVLSLAGFQRWMAKPGVRTALACGVLIGGTLAAKLSGVLILVILGFMLGWRLWGIFLGAAAPLPGPKFRRSLETALMGVTAALVLWGAYGFRYKASDDPSFDMTHVVRSESPVGGAARLLLESHLVPEAYAYGFADLNAHAAMGHETFLLGFHSKHGWIGYFPFALLVKTPFPALLLYGWAILAWARRRPSGTGAEDSLPAAAAIFLMIAMTGSLQIGIRHILPVLGFLAVLAGGISGNSEPNPFRRRRENSLAALAGLAASGVLVASPYYLAYFNFPSCVFLEPQEMLVDSNLDWGQDLGRLKRFMDREGIDSLKLGYFGGDSPRRLDLKHERLPARNLYSDREPEWRAATGVRPGDYVAVSATSYSGTYLEDTEYYRRLLGDLKPTKIIGGSILLFRIPEGRK